MKLILGDSLQKLKDLPTATVDAIVTDPPYGWRFMGKAWDGADIEKHIKKPKEDEWRIASDGRRRRKRQMFDTPDMSAGSYDQSFTGNQYFMHWTYDWAQEAIRVLKPGGHMLVFCGPRTYHAMAMGVEMAGFEIRDQLQWLFGSGFPKSQDVSKAIDKQAGVARTEVIGEKPGIVGTIGKTANQLMRESGKDDPNARSCGAFATGVKQIGGMIPITAPATDAARAWSGWGTALKPANEPIVLARKPLAKGHTVAQNVLAFGTGALNVDASRIGYAKSEGIDFTRVQDGNIYGANGVYGKAEQKQTTPLFKENGRWPANVLFDEEAAAMLDEQSGVLKNGGQNATSKKGFQDEFVGGKAASTKVNASSFAGDSGGASRFFYVAKSSRRERNAGLEGMPAKEAPGSKRSKPAEGRASALGAPRANHHPTVKPIKLMEYLVRMITPPGGIVLDPFMGSGTTGCAAVKLGYQFVGIEREAEYLEIARKRIEHWASHAPDEADSDPDQLSFPEAGA